MINLPVKSKNIRIFNLKYNLKKIIRLLSYKKKFNKKVKIKITKII